MGANVARLAADVRARHQHLVVGEVNDHVVKLAVNEDPYPWHHHPNSNEFFLVLEGELRVEFVTGDAVTLRPSDALAMPAGAVHRTVPNGRTVNLLVEAWDAATVFVERP